MAMTRQQVEYVTRLARLKLSEEEKSRFAGQLDAILQYAEKLNELDTSGIEPLIHAAERENVFREDTPRESLACRDALAGAPESSDGCFRVPRIIE